MRFFDNNTRNPDAYYEPNSFDGPAQDPAYKEPPLRVAADIADRFDHRAGNEDFSQPRALFLLFDAAQRKRLFSNIAEAMAGVPEHITERQCRLFDQVHPNYGAGVRAELRARQSMKAAAE